MLTCTTNYINKGTEFYNAIVPTINRRMNNRIDVNRSVFTIFKKYWNNPHIKDSDLYSYLCSWKKEVIAEFDDRTWNNNEDRKHFWGVLKAYINIGDGDISKSAIDFKRWFFDNMILPNVNRRIWKKNHEEIDPSNSDMAIFNLYFNDEHIKGTKLHEHLLKWKNNLIEILNNRTWNNNGDVKHFETNLNKLINVVDPDIVSATIGFKRWWFDNVRIHEINRKLENGLIYSKTSDMAMLNKYYKDQDLFGTAFHEHITSFKDTLVRELKDHSFYYKYIITSERRIIFERFLNSSCEEVIEATKVYMDWYFNEKLLELANQLDSNKLFIMSIEQARKIEIGLCKAVNIKLTISELDDFRLEQGTGIVWTIDNPEGMIYSCQTCDWENEIDLMRLYLSGQIPPKVSEKRAKHILSYKPTHITIRYAMEETGRGMKNSNKREQLLACESILNEECLIRQENAI